MSYTEGECSSWNVTEHILMSCIDRTFRPWSFVSCKMHSRRRTTVQNFLSIQYIKLHSITFHKLLSFHHNIVMSLYSIMSYILAYNHHNCTYGNPIHVPNCQSTEACMGLLAWFTSRSGLNSTKQVQCLRAQRK